ncbi:hypothetical protein HDZ31DRAFT_66854 [Schizophyllum fasciatum]
MSNDLPGSVPAELPPDADSNIDSDDDIPILPTVIASPRKNKVSSQPNAIRSTVNDDPGVVHFGYHSSMDSYVVKETDSATEVEVAGLPSAIFPEDAFPMQLNEFFDSMTTGAHAMYAHGEWQQCPSLLQSGIERPLATFLDRIGDAARALCAENEISVREVRRWSADFCNKPLPRGFVSRKPDVVALVLKRAPDWQSLRVDAQHKCNSKLKGEVALQLHDGALNCLTAQDDRHYHIGLGFSGEECFISYYDRSGCLQSQSFNIHAKPLEFLRVLLGPTLLDKRYLGYDPTIEERNGKRFIKIKEDVYEILQRLDHVPGIRGLGTVTWLCARLPDRKECVVKNSWTDRTRERTEEDYLKRAAKAGVSGVPTLIAYETVEFDGIQLSTATIRDVALADRPCVYETRDLTRLVMQERGVPIYCFSTKTEFLKAFRGAVLTHYELCDKAETLHCDVNDKNVLLNTDKPEGERRSLLIDLNYSMLINEERMYAASGWKSCPAVFVAADLLVSPTLIKPMPYHDLQSFLYLIIWICIWHCGPGGELRNFILKGSMIEDWLHIDEHIVGASKNAILSLKPKGSDVFNNFVSETFDEYFKDFKHCVCDLREVIMRLEPRPNHTEVIEVLDKHIPKIAKREQRALREKPGIPPPPTVGGPKGRFGDVAGMLAKATAASPGIAVPTGPLTSTERQTPKDARPLRKESRKRGADATDSPYFEGQCICDHVAYEGERVYQCRNPRCGVFYHEDCVKLKKNQQDTTWVCFRCQDAGFKLPKKKKVEV